MSSVVSRDWRSAARSVLRWLPGLAVTTLAIWLLSRVIDWHDFTAALASVPIDLLVVTVAIYLASMIIRAFGWQFLLQRKVPIKPVIMALNEGYFLIMCSLFAWAN